MDTAVLAIAAKVNKKLGEGTLVLGSAIKSEPIPRCTTGSLSFDLALGGGWPMNQWVETIGGESTGKSVVAMKTVAANQALDPDFQTVWVDAERSWDPSWAQKLGIDGSRVLVMTDNSMEVVYQAVIEFLASKKIDCIVIDSLPALVPEREEEKTMEDLQVGLGALLTGKFFRKQQPATRRSFVVHERPVLGILINQWRERVGVLMGDPRTTPGGKAKNYFVAARVEIRRDEWITDHDVRVGQVIKTFTLKNKTAVPYRTAHFDFYFADCGAHKAGSIDAVKELLLVATNFGLVGRGGGGYYTLGERKWHGQDHLLASLREEIDLREQLERDLASILKPNLRPVRKVRRPARTSPK